MANDNLLQNSFCRNCNKDISHKHKGAIYCDVLCMKKQYTKNPIECFDKFYTINASNCWVWHKSIEQSGYGRIKINGRTIKAHRLSWNIHFGEIPPGLFVCHKCDNPPCVNPEHLFLGTAKDNTQDMIEKGRKAIINGEQVGTSKLTTTEVLNIFIDKRAYQEISEDYKVSRGLIGNIKRKEIWSHVTDNISKEKIFKDVMCDTWHLRKLNKQQVVEIKNETVLTKKQMSLKYNVDMATIRRILTGKTWKNV